MKEGSRRIDKRQKKSKDIETERERDRENVPISRVIVQTNILHHALCSQIFIERIIIMLILFLIYVAELIHISYLVV